jgi:peroxiredoxin
MKRLNFQDDSIYKGQIHILEIGKDEMAFEDLSRRRLLQSTAMVFGGAILQKDDFTKLPSNLPIPIDDGACDHLHGMAIPSAVLPSTKGGIVNLRTVKATRTIVYCYPRTGEPGKPSPDGWEAIPGARGCTPQSCSMRDHYHAIHGLQAEIYGVSTQTTAYQSEAVTRLHLPFALLSDAELRFTKALRLPTFSVNGWTLIKRLTIVVYKGRIEKVFYPVFPPDKHGEQVVAWLQAKQKGSV